MYPGGVLKASVGLTREAYRCRPLPFSGIDHAVVSPMGKSLPPISQLRVVKELALRTFPAHFPFTANLVIPQRIFWHYRGARAYAVTGLRKGGVIAAGTFREQLTPSRKWICRLGLRRLIPPFWFALDRRDAPWWSAKIEPVVRPHCRHAGTWDVAPLAAYYHAGQWPLSCPPSLPSPCESMSAFFCGRAMPIGVFPKAILISSVSGLYLSCVPGECFTFANLVS